MAHNTAQKIKLLILWDILCQYTDEEHALDTDEIKTSQNTICTIGGAICTITHNFYDYRLDSIRKKPYQSSNTRVDTAKIL